ncbi:hypothetical protein [Rhizobium leguminosarum]|uniref:hypothetical protein n=1 Tax=Rhizobium leguminosarum TaxID=384 RepID=UPI001C917BB6|nr:hypothetical protein [Rhizobium leguminosarum]MBY2906067.1 hypothetical protein [Rhizobium leguminosarum]
MSAFFAIKAGDRSFMFTDGAGYTADGVIRSFGTKVTVAATVPLAATSLGNADLGERTRTFLLAQAEKFGVDNFLDVFMPSFLAELKETYQALPGNRHNNLMVAMVVWSETRGIQHIGFQTAAEQDRDDIVPFALRDLGNTAMRGPEFPIERMSTVRQPLAGESQEQYLRHLGLEVMTFMRQRADVTQNRRGTADEPQFFVGGHIDLTTVDKAGARIERIHVWPDKIGERINPFATVETVVPFGNRAQRRAAGKLHSADFRRRLA